MSPLIRLLLALKDKSLNMARKESNNNKSSLKYWEGMYRADGIRDAIKIVEEYEKIQHAQVIAMVKDTIIPHPTSIRSIRSKYHLEEQDERD